MILHISLEAGSNQMKLSRQTGIMKEWYCRIFGRIIPAVL